MLSALPPPAQPPSHCCAEYIRFLDPRSSRQPRGPSRLGGGMGYSASVLPSLAPLQGYTSPSVNALMSAAPERFSRPTNLAVVQGSSGGGPRASRYRLELRVGLFAQSRLGALKVAL